MRFWLFFIMIIPSFPVTAQKEISLRSLGLKAPSTVNCTPVKDQSLSSTCWSFASISLIESDLLKKGIKADLSEMFVARYSMLRKIQRHLKLKGQNYFTPGGQFHDMIWVLKNHGILPESAYPGKPSLVFNHNHSELDTVLSRYVKKLVQDGITETNYNQDRYIDSVLDHYMGPVPKTIEYHGSSFTPHRYLSELDIHPDDYVEITSYSHHPFYSSFVLEDKYNWTHDAYYNIPVKDFSMITDHALSKGYTVGWDGDADDPYFKFYDGLAYLDPPSKNIQAERQKSFEDQSTLLTHMMHITGQVKDVDGNKWYYIKNSWGDSNQLGGFMFMNEEYFLIRTVAIIVNKAALPVTIREKFGWQ